MKLLLFRYQCADCGKWFEAPGDSGVVYGEFLLRSAGRGGLAYLYALDDPVFKEVAFLLRMDKRLCMKSNKERANLLHAIFGVACDPDVDGSEFQIARKPNCPACGSHAMQDWDSTEPPRFADVEVPIVSHAKWNALSHDEREQLISSALDRLEID